MKRTKNGDWRASDGSIISSSADPGDLQRSAREHSELADKYQVLADALRHEEDPSENRRYGFYKDSRGQWRDSNHRILTDDGYEDPLVQAHQLAGRHQVLAKDFSEASRLNARGGKESSRERVKGSDTSADDKRSTISTVLSAALILAVFIALYLLLSDMIL